MTVMNDDIEFLYKFLCKINLINDKNNTANRSYHTITNDVIIISVSANDDTSNGSNH